MGQIMKSSLPLACQAFAGGTYLLQMPQMHPQAEAQAQSLQHNGGSGIHAVAVCWWKERASSSMARNIDGSEDNLIANLISR